LTRSTEITGVALGIGLALFSTTALAQSTNDINLLTWLGGPDRTVLDNLIAGFEAKHPEFNVNINVVTSQGDARGGMRTALLGGDRPDILTNTWPAFREELAEAGILRDIAPVWEDKG